MRGAIPPLSHKPSWRDAQLKHRDNFTFYTLILPKHKVKNTRVIHSKSVQLESRLHEFCPELFSIIKPAI
jgi:hypothetical protein